MKTYVVTERHSVLLGAGIVFQANPEDVAGALANGAIVEVAQQQAQKAAENAQKSNTPQSTPSNQATQPA